MNEDKNNFKGIDDLNRRMKNLEMAIFGNGEPGIERKVDEMYQLLKGSSIAGKILMVCLSILGTLAGIAYAISVIFFHKQ